MKSALLGVLGLGVFAVGFVNNPKLGTPGPVVHPADNPYSKAKAELGRRLMFEGGLSKKGSTPCTWCHNPNRGWADGRTISIGDPETALNRHTPTLLGSAYYQVLFWDGRAKTLEEQVLLPLTHPLEMNMTLEEIPPRLKKLGYSSAFNKAFGTPEITVDRVAKAFAAFQRTLVENNTPYDQWLKGDKDAMSPVAIKGLRLFEGKAGCVNCHSGPLFSRATQPGVNPYEVTGVAQSPVLDPDSGRGEIEKNNPAMKGAFRVPSLRGVGKTGPYMHNGQLETLEEVVDFYNRGGDLGKLKKLGLTDQEKKALVEFLRNGITSEDTAGEE